MNIPTISGLQNIVTRAKHTPVSYTHLLSFFPGEVVDNVPAGLEDKLSRMIDEKAEEEQRFFHRNINHQSQI